MHKHTNENLTHEVQKRLFKLNGGSVLLKFSKVSSGVQADWTFILPSELPAKELQHLPRKMPLHGTTY
jgi:hypothetical protein